MAKTKKVDHIYGIGRRKSSGARVRLFHGKGESTVNGKPVKEYFSGAVAQKKLEKPFGATETSEKYYYSARVTGGGKEGQLSSLLLALARTLVKVAPEKNRIVLRRLSLLSRDSRKKQRRMVGTGGKARRQKQSPKR
jgi:small subunit ribosomal protein S9